MQRHRDREVCLLAAPVVGNGALHTSGESRRKALVPFVSQQPESENSVTSLELLFDLVFVFGFTQVTTVLFDDPTWSGIGHALLIIVALWWAWASYAWLTSTVDTNDGWVSAAMLAAMAAMFVAALAVPDAFGRQGGVFGVAFFVVNVMFLTLFALTTRTDTELLAAILRIVPVFLTASTLITVAGFVHGMLRPSLWLVALVIGMFGPLVRGMTGWRLQPAHFIERHGLIVIIAIGESLIAIGIGARNTGLSASVIVAAVLGLIVVISFWLGYFDFFPLRAQQLLADRSGEQRTALARYVFTYFHLPMVAAIVLFAFAMRATLVHVVATSIRCERSAFAVGQRSICRHTFVSDFASRVHLAVDAWWPLSSAQHCCPQLLSFLQ
jgi:low temperature requirement protein LtrA